jgi:AraC family transcriptional regulator, positive regulator of tynA and feaB
MTNLAWSETSTEAVPLARRFDYWRETVLRHTVARPARAEDRMIEARRMGVAAGPSGIGFWRFDVRFAVPLEVERTAERCRRDGGDDLFIAFPLQPIGDLAHNGRNGPIARGEAVLFDPARPWKSSLSLMDQFTLQFPRQRLTAAGEDLERLAGQALPIDAGLFELLIGHAGGLSAGGGRMSPTALAASLDFLEQITFEMLGRRIQAGGRAARRDRQLVDAAKREIARRLDDPALSVDTLVRALGVSRSVLYRAFKDEPRGVNAYVTEVRLERAHALLRRNDRQIGDVALECGYENLWTFNRLFRRRFGCTPSQVRPARPLM